MLDTCETTPADLDPALALSKSRWTARDPGQFAEILSRLVVDLADSSGDIDVLL